MTCKETLPTHLLCFLLLLVYYIPIASHTIKFHEIPNTRLEFAGLVVGTGITHTQQQHFPFMKREHPSSRASMPPKSSYEFDQQTVPGVPPQEFKKPNDIHTCNEQTKSGKSCSETNDFERHQPRLVSKSTVKEASHHIKDDAEATLQQSSAVLTPVIENTRTTNEAEGSEDTERERLKRHRVEVAGRVWIPDIWGQEELLKDWIDCSAFDVSIMNSSIMSARAALVEEGRRANSSRLRIENSC